MNKVFIVLRMNLDKCILRIKILRLFVIIGTFSTVVVFLIYSLPNDERETVTKFNQGFFSTWPKPASRGNQKSNQLGADISNQYIVKNTFIRDRIKLNREHTSHAKIKRLTVNRLQNDDTILLVNATKNLPRHSASNVHIFYTIPVKWSQQTTGFWPLLGTYAPDNRTLRHHFKNIQLTGANVLIVTWSPSVQEELLRHLFDQAQNFDIQIAIEIDSYPNRTISSIFNDIQYFYNEFWEHRSLYKVFVSSKNSYLPMFYIKNVESQTSIDWKKLLSSDGEISLRNSFHDAVFIGHISTKKDVSLIKVANFNGFYSRSVSNGATYASTWKYWSELKKTAEKFHLIFLPTVGPGYDEKQPKTVSRRRHRTNGQYYGVGWRTAIAIGAEFINIASYNDWLSGTQIEEAIPRIGFKDYSPGTPYLYIDLTRYWIHEYIKSWQTDTMKRMIDIKICNSSILFANCEKNF
ncbi:glycoprotein endo-alpha-1,2-mannosidase [Contarinia nasturtii]|uniref:glycoprotein endo-alpha-1,2-mannosidase n=1 Tax=Contarinia nasturtii TaxID=265458 RepID=UPI0012D384A0|nr:glycoprotein endo-alpha-1,2-mannosidase [Contarinia nasturtii]XP_031640895.1 glycoprotein endo-alpha-1,2-mannosidase [Contarinia nasturtii]